MQRASRPRAPRHMPANAAAPRVLCGRAQRAGLRRVKAPARATILRPQSRQCPRQSSERAQEEGEDANTARRIQVVGAPGQESSLGDTDLGRHRREALC
eukprot:746892-Alexandrium_andersonii.AAC.1